MYDLRNAIVPLAVFLISATYQDIAQAQTASADDRRSSRALEEIVVTATRRETTTREAPLSVSVLGDEELQRMGARGFSDYLFSVPGVHYTDGGRGRSQIVMRGVATSATTQNLQSATEILVDEFATTNRWNSWTRFDPHMFDISRVEVLRGPQGTLFGSGSMGGIIRVISNKPDPTVSEALIDIGTSVIVDGGQSQDYNFMVNTPLIEDTLAVRFVGYHREDAGYIDRVPDETAFFPNRVFPGSIEEPGQKDYNYGRSTGGRIMAAYDPTDRLSTRLSIMYEDSYLNAHPVSFQNESDGGKYEWWTPFPGSQWSDTALYNLYIDYAFESFNVMASTTHGDRYSWLTQVSPNRFDRYPGASVYPECEPVTLYCAGINPDSEISGIGHETTSWVQEVRFTDTSGRALQWVGGFYYFYQDSHVPQIWFNPAAGVPGGGVTPRDRHSDAAEQGYLLDALYLATSREAAVFGEVTYNFTDNLSVALGVRFYDTSFEFAVPRYEGMASRAFGTPRVPQTTQDGSGNLPRYSIKYAVNDAVNIYASVAQGFRLGQVNFGGGAVDPVDGRVLPYGFGSDSLWSYEIGAKMSLFDDTMRLDLAVFNIDWTDIQLTRFTATNLNYTDNAGDATSKGIEFSMMANPIENVQVGLSGTYTEATLESVLPGVRLTPGVRLPGMPEVNASGHINVSLNTALESYVRLSARYVSEVERSLANDPLQRSDAYAVADLRAGVYFGSGNELVLSVENIFNSDAAQTIDDGGNGLDWMAYRLKPTEIGISYKARFGGDR